MLILDGQQLSIQDIVKVSQNSIEVSLTPDAQTRIAESQKWVQNIAAGDKPVYGINTGFGIFANKFISPQDTIKLNRNLILSHAVGTGPDLPDEVVRAAMVIRANTLASGNSGIRLETVNTLLEMLNRGVIPIIPSQGSLGSSGDLAPLSHLALVMTTDEKDLEAESGWAKIGGNKLSGKSAMSKARINRVILGPKEGLALTNGATFSAALAALVIHQAQILVDTADIALAMSLEALLGASAAFDNRLHQARRQNGQITVANRIRELTSGSTLLDAAGRVQDAYSLRCGPQVQGPVRDTLTFAQGIIENEINAVTDNPLLFGPDEAISGGNFHGQPIGMVMDYLKIALAELGAISERRTYHLTDEKINAGLPPMLVSNVEAAGLNSGMMMPQYTAASLVLENQNLASPDSVHSLPTSGGKEDHNANAMTAARHAWQAAQNTAHILAIEIYCAARALDLRMKSIPDAKFGNGVGSAQHAFRQVVAYQQGDAWWGPEIERTRQWIMDGHLNKAVEANQH